MRKEFGSLPLSKSTGKATQPPEPASRQRGKVDLGDVDAFLDEALGSIQKHKVPIKQAAGNVRFG